MSRTATHEYILRQREDYIGELDKRKRGRILDEVCRITGLDRKYACRLLRGKREYKVRPGRGKTYSRAAEKLLVQLWTGTGCPCTKYLVCLRERGLKDLARLQNVPDDLAAQVLSMSASTMDRVLRGKERPAKVWGRRNRRSGANNGVKDSIPCESGERTPACEVQPGDIQVVRLETQRALALLLEAVNTYNNYFRPCVMLVEKKKRPDGKGYRCRYDRPRTPAQRAMECGVLTPEQTRKIQKVLAETNVVHLVELIQKRRNHLLRLLRSGDVRDAARGSVETEDSALAPPAGQRRESHLSRFLSEGMKTVGVQQSFCDGRKVAGLFSRHKKRAVPHGRRAGSPKMKLRCGKFFDGRKFAENARHRAAGGGGSTEMKLRCGKFF